MNNEATEGVNHGRRGLPWAVILPLAAWCWAIWSCAEHWKANPNYSYGWAVPLLAVGFALRRYWRLPEIQIAPRDVSLSGTLQLLLAIGATIVVFGLEYWREQIWHPEIVLWSICLIAVVSSLTVLYLGGGAALARAEFFPSLFF